tara:strand:- start:1742 stop:2326 length:585 start_codon:yes stop_codon:yes gene_type:complete
MNLDKINFIHLLTSTLIIETFMLILFRYTKSKFSGKSINDWYDKFKFIAIFLDIAIILIGFYVTIFISKKYNINNYYTFLALQIILQIIHDILFYIFFSKYPKNTNPIIDEFKIYAKNIGVGAIIGDSYMYLLGIPILILLTKINKDKLIFISLISSYLIGYLTYQKPLYKIKTNHFEFLIPLLLNFSFFSFHQ